MSSSTKLVSFPPLTEDQLRLAKEIKWKYETMYKINNILLSCNINKPPGRWNVGSFKYGSYLYNLVTKNTISKLRSCLFNQSPLRVNWEINTRKRKETILKNIKKGCYNDRDYITNERFDKLDYRQLSKVVKIGTGKKKHCFELESIFNIIKKAKELARTPLNPANRSPILQVEINNVLSMMKKVDPNTRWPNKEEIILAVETHYIEEAQQDELMFADYEDDDDNNNISNALDFDFHNASNVDEVINAIERGANVNRRDEDGNTALHLQYNTAIVNVLIEHDANVDAENNIGQTPLYTQDSVDVVDILINSGADVNYRDDDDDTPLHIQHNDRIARLLIEHGADVNAKNSSGYTPLNQQEHPLVAEALIDGVRAKSGNVVEYVNAKDEYGYTSLHLNFNPSVVNVLINKGANVNAVNIDGKTPLHIQSKTSIIKALVDAGANVNARDNNSRTPLFTCWDECSLQIFLYAGADTSIRDKDGYTYDEYQRINFLDNHQ